ncbi:hypothetical protein LDO26_02750 [Luteimonas sp. BDR2-5]|uniref:hypothetical protein n=1 Tax=Proluteimonas luteida TaxID=2878685 RepID=UPI001E4B7656|nr:hypothetical protein [Luteimonas sp. BDR2-5]MCD9027133.1 hypothetical protein [Luteimonas sp. BDR2-5]
MSAPLPRSRAAIALLACGIAAGAATDVLAADPIACELTFAADDWSPHRQAAHGLGHVRCADGSELRVRVSIKGVVRGDAGTPRVRAGAGSFTGVTDPRDVLGGYSVARGDSGPNLLMRKGGVTLTVTGTGDWWAGGGRPGSLVISPR